MSTFDEETAAAAAATSPAPMSARSFSQLLDELQQTRDSIARSMAGALEHATSEDSPEREDQGRNPVATFSLSGSRQSEIISRFGVCLGSLLRLYKYYNM